MGVRLGLTRLAGCAPRAAAEQFPHSVLKAKAVVSSILLIQSDLAASRRLQDVIDADARFTVIARVATLADARASLATRVPDLLIADLRLPDGHFSELLRVLRPDRSRSVVLTASLHDPHLMHALRSGADGYLLAGQSTEAILHLLRRTLAGEAPIAPEIARQVLALFDVLNARPIGPGMRPSATLSLDERRLLDWTSEGYRVQELARGLGITAAQVGLRVHALYRRMRFAAPAARAPATLRRVA